MWNNGFGLEWWCRETKYCVQTVHHWMMVLLFLSFFVNSILYCSRWNSFEFVVNDSISLIKNMSPSHDLINISNQCKRAAGTTVTWQINVFHQFPLWKIAHKVQWKIMQHFCCVVCFSSSCWLSHGRETVERESAGEIWQSGKSSQFTSKKRLSFLLFFPSWEWKFSHIFFFTSPHWDAVRRKYFNCSSQFPIVIQLVNTHEYSLAKAQYRRIIKNLISKWSAEVNNVEFNLLNLIGKWKLRKSREKEKSNYHVVNFDRLQLQPS